MVGGFYGMLLLSAKLSRSLVWWENTIWETFWGTFWSNITLFQRKTNLDCTSLEQKSCQVKFSEMHHTRVESGKETLRSQTLQNWRRRTHRNSTPEDSMQRKCQRSKENGKFVFPVADGTVKIFGWDQRLRTSTFRWIRFSNPTSRRLDAGDDEEAKSDFWTITGEFIYCHHVEPRVKLYMPKEESFPIPLRYIDVTGTTHTSLDVLLGKQIEDVDGER